MQKGTLKVGTLLVFGDETTRIKNLQNDHGKNLDIAFPGDAVQIVGIPCIPNAGDYVFEAENEKKAKFIIEKRKEQAKAEQTNKQNEGVVATSKIKLKGRREKKKFGRGFNSLWNEKFSEVEDKLLERI